MFSTKRLAIATVVGLVFGLITGLLIIRPGAETTVARFWPIKVSGILCYTVVGFAIGISSWRIGWWLHGILIGIIFSVPLGVAALSVTSPVSLVSTVIFGIIWGVLIELITTVAFKARMSEVTAASG